MAGVVRAEFGKEVREGVTYAQAMEVFERFFVFIESAPAIADRMSIPYSSCCLVLDGGVWPGAYRIWVRRVLP